MNGVFIVDKPARMTSHDAVAICRKALGEKRVGHAGTLDPDATGVLVLGVGRATRLLQFLSGDDKEYVTEAVFGEETTTYDAAGETVAESDASALDAESLEKALEEFRGDIEQVPPMVSAVKIAGERLYEKARRGETVDRPPRKVTVHELECETFVPGARARARLRVRCSKGTYVRSLVHDLGRAVGTGAHVATLRRIASGHFREADAISLEQIAPERMVPMEAAVAEYPRRDLTGPQAVAVLQGRAIEAAGIPGAYAAVGPGGLVAMMEDRGAHARPLCVVGPQ